VWPFNAVIGKPRSPKWWSSSGTRPSLLDRHDGRGSLASGDPPEVSTWLHEGTDALRVVALNVMLARAKCRDVLAALKAIDEPHSLFEQYYGLRLVREMVPSLEALERQLVADAVRRAWRHRSFRRDPPPVALSNAILARARRGVLSRLPVVNMGPSSPPRPHRRLPDKGAEGCGPRRDRRPTRRVSAHLRQLCELSDTWLLVTAVGSFAAARESRRR
jgi:hypothetical protein